MKKLLSVLAIATLTLPVVATAQVTKLSTADLKSLDCAGLAVEKNNANRQIKDTQSTLDNAATAANNPTNTVSKWAGMAGSALSAFNKNSESVAKANDVANNLSANNTSLSDQQLAEHRTNLSNAQANLENIGVYQSSKKCK